MNKKTEYLVIPTIVLVFVLVGVTDPVVWHWIASHCLIVNILCGTAGLAIGGVYAILRGRKQYARGAASVHNQRVKRVWQ